MTKSLSKKNIWEIFSRFSKITPEPKGELEYTSPYTLLVAVVLSAQSTDVGVNKATKKLFSIAKFNLFLLAKTAPSIFSKIEECGYFISCLSISFFASLILFELNSSKINFILSPDGSFCSLIFIT